MIPKDCKRLAEVDFPIAVVSRHAAREKSIRHGHPSTLHLWWARRPLASCRAVLLGILLPDPCDPQCPQAFKAQARNLLPRVQGNVGAADADLQKALLKFIGDVANWDFAAHPVYLEVGRALVKAAYGEETPLVVDPFAGGGSIPLEALRLGCEAFASDLNPVACLILKVMLENIPRETHRRGAENAESLADELRRIGREIKEKAEQELAEFYPRDPDGATPIAYLWARTVRCEAPNCGAEIPLVRSFWLCKKPNRKIALRPLRLGGEIAFEIFQPKSEKEVPEGTVSRVRATCLCCGAVLPPERVRAQLAAQRGGADVRFDDNGTRIGGARLLAVVTLKPGQQGRHYRLPTDRDYEAVWKAQQRLAAILNEWKRGGRQGLCPVPDEPIHAEDTRNFWVCKYGPQTFGDLFTARQKLALVTLSRLVRGLTAEAQRAQSEAVREGIALQIAKGADGNSSGARWMPGYENPANTFGRQALPIVWDFCESTPYADARGVFLSALDSVGDVIASSLALVAGHTQLADATAHPLPDAAATVWFTDPPYYDAVPYADLSDFFFVWLKRALAGHPLLRDPFDPANPLTPKSREAVQNERSETDDGRPKDKAFYEATMAKAFTEGRRVLREDGVGAVVFAHKTTEGWEALLSGLIRGGWTITGSWPIATEMASRLRARDSAALATSVHLVCRPRPDDAPVGDWANVLRELPKRVANWMERLQSEGIRGADLVFACIGPALEIFSRYARVETADGREVTLAEYLEKVWEVVGRTALENVLGTAEARARNGAAGALEEDARLTALFLWTLQSTNGATIDHRDTTIDHRDTESTEEDETETDEEEDSAPARSNSVFSLPFDVVRRFAQPLGIELSKWERRIIETKKGVVRLMAVSERTRQLFGKDGADAVADWIAEDPQKTVQGVLFPEMEDSPQKRRGRKGIVIDEDSLRTPRLGGEKEATTLDRVHLAMLLQAGGQASALRTLLEAEQKRGPEFLRLANALSALYPKGSKEKRLLDAMLLAVPR